MAAKLGRLNLGLAYAATLAVSLWLGYELRFDFAASVSAQADCLFIYLWVITLQMLCLWRFGQFRVLLHHFGVTDFSHLFLPLFTSSLITFGISSHAGTDFAPPRGVVLADFSLSVLGLTAIRLAFRRMGARVAAVPGAGLAGRRARRAGIIGAGLVGSALAQQFAERRELGLRAVAFFDDDRRKWGTLLEHIPVVGAPEILLSDKGDLELEEVIIAMPSAPAKRVTEIVQILQRLHLKFRTVPSFYELTTGQAKVSQLRPVQIQDLLGREPVPLTSSDIEQMLRAKVVMVTGAGGSIGSELCRQIAAYAPRALLLLDQSEVQLFQIHQELVTGGFGKLLVPLLADVLDEARLEFIFRQHSPQIIFHAAAHKHVPMVEMQPGEGIKNNTLGTLRLAETCLRHHVDRFVFISSDKAVKPTNVMGATKRLAEMCVQSLHAAFPDRTRFMAVRFGNVLGSSGSVVPIFNKQIAAGGPVTITHPEVTRYFMTIPEAAGLVLQSAAQGRGGEIFTLDMGQPVKIVDLARQLIELSGFTPGKDILIEFVGLRPGEKLYEELSYKGESIVPTRHPKILSFCCTPLPLEKVRHYVEELVEQVDQLEPDGLKRLLQWAVPEYRPQLKREAQTDAPAQEPALAATP